MTLSRIGRVAVLVTVVLAVPLFAARAGNPRARPALKPGHPAVGSWFGKAVQLTGGEPGLALYMTPTLTADGNFLGNDSLALAGAPFGPHTTAHGLWQATGRTSFSADYVFMLPSLAGAGFISGARFRWDGDVVDRETMVGFVNIWLDPALPEDWEDLGPNDFPTTPPGAAALVEAPDAFFTDPADCAGLGCLVFKFTVHRIQGPSD